MKVKLVMKFNFAVNFRSLENLNFYFSYPELYSYTMYIYNFLIILMIINNKTKTIKTKQQF